jgi:hypothetical protein
MSKARQLADLGGDTANLEDISSVLSSGPLSNRNKILNGQFDVWQRGTSFTTTGSFIYFADRWRGYNYTAGSRVDRQTFTVGQTDVPDNPKYYIRLTTGGSEYWLAQRIEDVQTCAGQTVTLSWWGRASSNTTITARTTQEFGSGGSSAVNVATQNFTFTTSWQKFTWTTDIASISGKTVGTNSFLQVWWQGNLASAGTTIDFAQVQLEVGDTATPFEHRSYGQELALCQRYYETSNTNGQRVPYIILAFYNPGDARGHFQWQVEKRTTPTVTYNGANWNLYGNGGGLTDTGAVSDGISTKGVCFVITGSGFPAGEAGFADNRTDDAIVADAEL